MGEMRSLTRDEIESLACRKNVKRIAVENFLGTMGTNSYAAYENAQMDKELYKWNAPTFNAIMKGIEIAQHPYKKPRACPPVGSKPVKQPSMTKLMRQAMMEGGIQCPRCGRSIESDNPSCQCGWKNPLVSQGLI